MARKKLTPEQGEQELARLHARVAELEAELARVAGASGLPRGRFRQVLDSADDVIWCMDAEGRFTYVSRAVRSSLGHEPETLIGKTFDIALTETAAAEARAFLDAYLRGELGTPPLRLELVHRRKDGTEFWGELIVHPILDDQGRLVEIQGITRDVSERKRAEEALRESEERFRRIFDEAPIGAAIVALDYRFARVNETLCRITGYSAEELTTLTFKDITHPDDLAIDVEQVRRLTVGEINEYRQEKRYVRKDGAIVWGRLSVRLIKDAVGQPLYFLPIIEDINDRKRAEEEREKLEAQWRQAQKMEAVGQLAGGVAHDFNNLLQVISGYGEMLAAYLGPGTRGHLEIKEVMKAAERAGALVRQLLAFSRRETIRPRNLDLNDLIRDLSKMLRRVISEHIDLQLELGEGAPVILADPGQLEQVLMNLCVNARDAMPGGGKLVVETRSVALNEDFMTAYPEASPGQYVLLRVSDTGHGMEPDVLDRMFEPFFTTKSVGKGTGLGLATVYGIVKQHGGIITCSSAPGKGAAFSVYLPATSGAAEQSDYEDAFLEIPCGTETILFAEDEPLVRNLGRQILTSGGYRVLAAKDGHEALAVYEAHSKEIALAVLDMVMPGLNGKTVADRIKSHNPHMPILFSSGYDFSMLEGALSSGEVANVIRKPYRQREFLRRVRELLDS